MKHRIEPAQNRSLTRHSSVWAARHAAGPDPPEEIEPSGGGLRKPCVALSILSIGCCLPFVAQSAFAPALPLLSPGLHIAGCPQARAPLS